MKNNIRKLAHILILIIGLGLMIGGLFTGKHGAVVIGLIIAAVNIHPLMSLSKMSVINKSNE